MEIKRDNITKNLDQHLDKLFQEDGDSGIQDIGAVREKVLPDIKERNRLEEDDPEIIEEVDIIEPTTSYEETTDSPLREIKGHLLSLDWEISDENINSLIEDATSLKEQFKDNKPVHGLLKLMMVLANYIKAKRSKAHPDSIRLLNSSYNALEILLLEKDLPEQKKKEILYREIKLFKRLKQKIAKRQNRAEIKKGEKVLKSGDREIMQDLRGMEPHEAFAYALEEIKQVIKSEFSALRAELKLWREYH